MQDSSAPYVPSSQAQKLISSYTEVARASYDQMADLTRRASLSGASFSNMPPLPPAPPSFDQFEFAPLREGQNPQNGSRQQQQQPQQRAQHGLGPSPYESAPRPPTSSSAGGQSKSGSRVDPASQQSTSGPPAGRTPGGSSRPPPVAQYVHPAYANDPAYAHLAHQQPPQQHAPPPPQQHVPPPPPHHNPTGRRESTVPGWAVPPRVLLVEDDTVCRKLSSKFLEKFGCQIDVALDGVSAVNKMNAQKYDLVLMVSWHVPLFNSVPFLGNRAPYRSSD